MTVKMLRLTSGCYAFKGTANVMAGKGVTISVVGGGDYLVEYHGKCFRVPAHRVDFAEVEDVPKAAKVPVSALKS